MIGFARWAHPLAHASIPEALRSRPSLRAFTIRLSGDAWNFPFCGRYGPTCVLERRIARSEFGRLDEREYSERRRSNRKFRRGAAKRERARG